MEIVRDAIAPLQVHTYQYRYVRWAKLFCAGKPILRLRYTTVWSSTRLSLIVSLRHSVRVALSATKEAVL